MQYLRTLVRGGSLRQFDLLSTDIENTDTYLTVDYLLKGLLWYFFLWIRFQNKSVQCGAVWKKTRSLKVRIYAARLIDLNEYLASFLGAAVYDKIGITELNDILLNSLSNSWYKQAYVQGFYYKSIYF